MTNYFHSLFIPILFVSFIILSIISFIKRNKIIAKYDVGYVSSFFFSAYMLMPVFALATMFPTFDALETSELPAGIFFIYPIIGLSIFLFVNRNKPLRFTIGKLFAMIGIGICSGYILLFKFLGIINFLESSPKYERHSNPIPNTNISNDIFRGRINEYGEIYDYGGKFLGRINDNGDILYPNGEYYAHKDYSGDVYTANGKYLGRIKEDGEIQNAEWVRTGKLNNE